MITLADVFEALSGTRPLKADAKMNRASVQSRLVQPNDLFIALPGSGMDGHNFIGDAFHRGARVAIVQNDQSHLFPVIDLRSGRLPDDAVELPKVPFCIRVEDTRVALQVLARYWRQKLNPHVVAVASGQGNSITRHLVVEMLEKRFTTIIPALQDDADVELSLDLLNLRSASECILLILRLDEPAMLHTLCSIAAPLVGMVGYVSNPVCCSPITQAEMDSAKDDFLSLLSPGPAGSAILNYDDLKERSAAKKIQARPVFYGLNPQADLWADEIESQGHEGIRFRIHYCHESLTLRVPLLGRRSVHAALQAAAVGLVEGLSWHDIATGLRMGHAELRLMTANAQIGALILDDTYSVSAESTLAVFNLMEKMDGRKIAVLAEVPDYGFYGDRHEMVGARAAEVVEELVAVGELAQPVAEAARKSGSTRLAVTWVKNPQEAIEYLRPKLRKNDVLLVKGSNEFFMDKIVSGLEGYAS